MLEQYIAETISRALYIVPVMAMSFALVGFTMLVILWLFSK